MKFLAYDLRFGKVVIQSGTLDGLKMILREGDYPLALMILIESAEMTARDWDMARVETGARVYAINRMLDGST